MTARNRNELWGRILVDELVRAGVEHLVLAPGSRSAPVVLAAVDDGRLQLHVQVDERAAGFVALGVGKGGGPPAAVLTTSGTAVANLLPAVVEASQSATPLLVLTADRPVRLRGADANQTIDQPGIFGGYVRRFEEVAPAPVTPATLRHLRSVVARSLQAAIGAPAGPVHLNLAFDKPLEPIPVPGDLPEGMTPEAFPALSGREGDLPWTRVRRRRFAPAPEGVAEVRAALESAHRPLLVAGVLPRSPETNQVGALLRQLAGQRGVPVLADPLSGARYPAAPGVHGGYAAALADPEVRRRLRPDLVIRFGADPVCAALGAWLGELEGVTQYVVDGEGERWKDHGGYADAVLPVDPAYLLEALLGEVGGSASVPGWAEGWDRLERAVRGEIDRIADAPAPFEGSAVARVVEGLPEGTILFASNSMPVREVDTFVPARSSTLQVVGNRGASGIDGIVSTAAGLSLSTGRHVVAIVGDLALLHDGNGLASLARPGVRVTVVVLNNDGGGIFHLLPVRDQEPAFTPYFATPHGLDLERLAALHRLAFRRVEWRGEGGGGESRRVTLDGALADVLAAEAAILEIRTDREENRRLREAAVRSIGAAAAQALEEDDG